MLHLVKLVSVMFHFVTLLNIYFVTRCQDVEEVVFIPQWASCMIDGILVLFAGEKLFFLFFLLCFVFALTIKLRFLVPLVASM